MKNTMLWSALFTLISAQVYADQTPALTPAQTPNNSLTAPASPAGAAQNQLAPAAPAPASAPLIDCNYKIPAETKKVDPTLILTWAEKATSQAFSFDPTNIDAQMQKLQACFTEQGWAGFNTALQKSGNIEAIKSQKLMVTSHIDGSVLINDAKDNQWKLTLPLTVIYQNDKEKVSQSLNIDLTISRKPNGDLGITQMIAVPRGTANQAPSVKQ